MQPPSRILAAVDFSQPARAAFDRALALSRVHGAELTVVHAVPADQPFRWRARERVTLMAELRKAAGAVGVRFTVSVQHGDPATVVALHAKSRQTELVVLGTHRRRGIARLRKGSVAERVMLQARVPLLIVPAVEGVPASSRPFDRILVAVGFDAAAQRAIDHAVALMAEEGSQMTVVHVVPGTSKPVLRHAYRAGAVEYRKQLVSDAWNRLQHLVSRSPAAPRVRARVTTGDPSAEIVRVADEVDADVIVVGVAPRSALSRVVLGDTVRRLMRMAGRPILTVPAVASGSARRAERDERSIAA